MRLAPELAEKVLELDRRYRSSWDVRSIAHMVGISHTTAAKILREHRGARPRPARASHERRTRFLRRDVMWSSDFTELPDKRKLLRTMDERSRFRLGWDIASSETAEAVVRHAEDLIARMGRAPLIWKFDHGSAFMSAAFQELLARHRIVPYAIPPRSPWANGRTERDNREIKNWLIPAAKAGLAGAALENDADEGMWMLNYEKPRAVLGFRTSASVYFHTDGISEEDRTRFRALLPTQYRSEGELRKEVRRLLQEAGFYEEWIVGSAASVNR